MARRLFATLLIILAVSVSFTTSTSASARGIDPEFDEVLMADIREYACEYGIADSYLIALIEIESNGDPNAYNPTYGCTGLCQINPSSHRERMERLGVTDLYDQEQNLRVACDYLRELFEEYDDPYIVAGKYHGEHDVETRAERGEFSYYQRTLVERCDVLERLKNGVG